MDKIRITPNPAQSALLTWYKALVMGYKAQGGSNEQCFGKPNKHKQKHNKVFFSYSEGMVRRENSTGHKLRGRSTMSALCFQYD